MGGDGQWKVVHATLRQNMQRMHREKYLTNATSVIMHPLEQLTALSPFSILSLRIGYRAGHLRTQWKVVVLQFPIKRIKLSETHKWTSLRLDKQ